jgi:MurNAc alpha-1-phosphate uridylyltransferase
MKAMILAAGKGTRMQNLTATTPKPLLNIGPCTLIERHLYRLADMNIRECVINLRYLSDKIAEHLGNGDKYQLSIQYSHETEDLETGGGIINALNLLGNEPFMLLSGDIVTDFPFNELQLPNNKLAHLALVPNPPHHPKGDFELHSNQTITPITDDNYNYNNYTYGNVGIYHPDLFKPHPAGYRKLADILKAGMDQQLITGELYEGRWLNVDTPDRLAIAREWSNSEC